MTPTRSDWTITAFLVGLIVRRLWARRGRREMNQPALALTAAVEVITVTLTMDDLGYWALRLNIRDRAARRWVTDSYEGLTAAEALDVLDGVIT